MEKTISTEELADELGNLLVHVSKQGSHYVVERDGEPLAAIVPFALYAQWKRQRTAFFGQMRTSADRAGLGDDEAIQMVEEAKRAVRARR